MKEKAQHGYLWQERVRLNGSSLGFLFHQATFRCIWKEMTAFNLIPGLYPSADIASGHCLCHSASHGNVQYCSASMGFRRSVLSSVSFYTNTLWLPLIHPFVPYSSTKLVWKHFCLILIKKQNISSRKNKGPEKSHRESFAGRQSHWKGIGDYQITIDLWHGDQNRESNSRLPKQVNIDKG